MGVSCKAGFDVQASLRKVVFVGVKQIVLLLYTALDGLIQRFSHLRGAYKRFAVPW